MRFEAFDIVCSKIRGYLSATNQTRLPYFINTNNRNEYLRLKDELLEFLSLWRVSSCCNNPDDLPDLDNLFSKLRNTTDKVLLLGFSNHLKLLTRADMQTYLGIAKDFSVPNGKLVVLCFQFQEQLRQLIKRDHRLVNRVLFLESDNITKSSVTFINPDIDTSNIECMIPGYQHYLYIQEECSAEDGMVNSKMFYNDYSCASIAVTKIKTYYQMVTIFDRSCTTQLSEFWGTIEQWKYLLELLISHKTCYKTMKAEFGITTNLKSLFYKWNNMGNTKQWLFFTCLKMFETQDSYLYDALKVSNSVAEFVKNLYRKILDYNHTNNLFDSYYLERKELISHIKDLNNICTFCQMAEIKGMDEIYYLTDLSDREKQEIITYLSKMDDLDNHIITIISKVYPELAKYLREYYFGNPMLDEYFQTYKHQKVINKIQANFLDLVNKHAEERKFNLLPSRNDIFERINKEDGVIYFIDALGVEFLGYISAVCKELGLNINISVCRANLPTTTFYNKDFLNGIAGYRDIKDLDKLKHEGEGDFNYIMNKLPLHIVEELKIIRSVLEKVKVTLSNHKKAIIVSDHGASRLVIINEKQYNFDVQSNGTHGGRCCVYTNDLPQVDYATIENGQYILASYDRFKGGRAARVETHGGATLEEVVVPIIEVTRADTDIEVQFVESTILVSFKKKATLRLFSTKKLDKAMLKIDKRFYLATEENTMVYTFPIIDIKRAGDYSAEVYDGDNLIIDELKFSIKKESASENDLL